MTWRSRGQSMTEYLVIVSVLVALLFMPWIPRPDEMFIHPDSGARMSVVMFFIEMFDIYIASFHTVITLPVP